MPAYLTAALAASMCVLNIGVHLCELPLPFDKGGMLVIQYYSNRDDIPLLNISNL